MSQENVERSYRVIDAFNRGDVEAARSLLDEDVEVIWDHAEALGTLGLSG